MTQESNENEKISMQVRLQRTVIEYGYVNVEITSELIKDQHLDVESICKLALEHGTLPEMQWYVEQTSVAVHPLQKGREADEKSLLKGAERVELI
jgi:hypothetical protein